MQLRPHILSALLVSVAAATVSQAQNGFKSFGPPNEFGYPSYYVDHQDLPLEHCIDQNDPLCGIPPEDFLIGPPVITDNPAEGNFFHETFYWSAFASVNIAGRGDAELVLALEGVFGNLDEAVVDGDQTVFSRLRIRLRGDGFEGGFYRIGTPYGTYIFDAPAVQPGTRIVNHTVDCLHVFLPTPPPTVICGQVPFGPGANFFTTPLGVLDDGTIAPQYAPNGPNFLSWDPTVPPLAPPGYVGDPRVLHQVVGAVPPNRNEFRIQFSRTANFSNIVFDERTDLFSVIGKIAAVDACDLVEPVADFGASPLSGDAPLTVNFSDLSTCANSWLWDFGDGQSSTQQSPSHVYTAPGIYTVSLTATGNGGSNTRTRAALITVTDDPPPPSGLVLGAPIPGTAGIQNSLTVTGGTPGRPVGFYTGLVLGASTLNLGSCGGIPIGLSSPFRLLGRVNVNAAGTATLLTTPPATAAGRTFHFQVVEPFSCRTSNIVSDQL